ncbi:HD domain-containing protein [Geminocystis sp. GBBB08]|uniref:HD domain-containing protein n=1 Tax=Geminocystis sp. GBBB08 TaxID=2604140 RepID=UPI0027E37B91|nr:HD domain-containing protein [Geminocystis sp. GBBB08]
MHEKKIMATNSPSTTLLTNRFQEALVFASQLHSTQIRKMSGIPYISHLLSVTALVLEDHGTENEAIAALLHDAIEDQGGQETGQLIRVKFGDIVANLVEDCTEPKEWRQLSWRERKQKYIDKFSNNSLSARKIALADKLHNARSNRLELLRYGNKAWDTMSKGKKEGTLWFYQSIIEASKKHDPSFLVNELEQVVKELEHL